MIGLLKAQEVTSANGNAASEPKQEATQNADPPHARFPLDVAGYLSIRTFNDAALYEHHRYAEYAGSIFVSKKAGRWLFHSEFNADNIPSDDSEGVQILRRGSWIFKLDNVFVNYNWRDYLQAEAGLLFVPTYSRTHRYQSTTLTVEEPLIDENIFPTMFKGVMIHGDKYFEKGGVSYQIYGGVNKERSFNTGVTKQIGLARSIGGKLVLHLPNRGFFDAFDVGFQRLHELYPGLRRDQTNGWELHLEKGQFELLAEAAHSSIRPVDGTPGHFREGYYLQPSYRITRNLLAVARYDLLDRDNTRADKNALARQSLGLICRPWALLSLKIEADRYQAERGRLPAYYGASVGVVYFFHLP